MGMQLQRIWLDVQVLQQVKLRKLKTTRGFKLITLSSSIIITLIKGPIVKCW